MKRIILTIIVLWGSLIASAQNFNEYVTTQNNAGRYEVVMSSLQASQTFKVDKYNGDVYQLVETPKGGLVFEKLDRDTSNAIDTQIPDRVNYQFVMSGILAKCTFLVNVNTGEVWNLVHDNKQKVNWLTYLD